MNGKMDKETLKAVAAEAALWLGAALLCLLWLAEEPDAVNGDGEGEGIARARAARTKAAPSPVAARSVNAPYQGRLGGNGPYQRISPDERSEELCEAKSLEGCADEGRALPMAATSAALPPEAAR